MPKIHVKYHTDPSCANPKCSTALAAEKAAGATQIEHMPRCARGGKGVSTVTESVEAEERERAHVPQLQ